MSERKRRVLDPVERVSEVLFGLIMVLTFTGSMSAASAGRAEVREMLVGAIGCNLAWGIVDAVMYVLTSVLNRARGLSVLHAVRSAGDAEQARGIVAGAIDPFVASVMRPSIFEDMRQDLAAAPNVPGRASLKSEDFRGAFEVFLLVFLSTFPVVVPFLIFGQPLRAMRVSNTVAVAMLGAGGYSLGRFSGLPPWPLAAAMAMLGALLAGITIALGG